MPKLIINPRTSEPPFPAWQESGQSDEDGPLYLVDGGLVTFVVDGYVVCPWWPQSGGDGGEPENQG